MGNVSSVKLKEDIAHLEINEKLVQEFQYHIKLVDHSMAAFARTTNSLRESFATVKQHKDDGNGDSSVNGVDGGAELGHTLKYMTILETIDDALSDQSFIVVDSLTRLLNFIIETGKRCNTIIPDDALLFINKYKSGTFGDALDKEMQYHDVVIESMQKKLKRVNESYRLAKREIDNMNKREALYQDEKLLLNGRIHDLDTNFLNVKVELENIRKDKNALETDNGKLKREVSDLKLKIKEAQSEISIEQSNFEMLSKTLQSDKEECVRKLGESNNENEELKKTLNDKQNEIDSLKVELNNVTSLKEQNETRIKSLEKEKQKLDEDNGHLKSLQEQINKVLIEHHLEDRKEMITHEKKTKTLFSDEISKVNAKIDETSSDMLSLNKAVTRMTNEVKDVHIKENERLSNCIVQSKIEEQNYIKAINKMKEKILQFEEEGKSLEKFNALEKENTQLQEKVDQLVILQKSREEKIERCRSKIKRLLKEKEDQAQKIEEQVKRIETYEKHLNDSKNELHNLKSNLLAEHETRLSVTEENFARVKSLQDEISKMRQASTDLAELHIKNDKNVEEAKKATRNEILLLQKQVEEKDKKIQSLEKDMINLTDEKKKMTDEKHTETQMLQEETKEKDDMTNVVVEYARQTTDLNENKVQMQKDIEEKDKEIRSLKKEITKLTDEKEEAIKSFEIKQHLAAQRQVFVQVTHNSKFRQFKTEAEVQMKLKLKCIPENIDLKFVCITREFIMMSDVPVFVVCPRQFDLIRDRDIHNIVKFYKDLKMNKMTALVFFHDKGKKAFEKEGGGKGSHDGRTFCDVFDIIYDRDGISECDENSTNIEQMFEFITNACRLRVSSQSVESGASNSYLSR